jgi:hypothetical protein
MIFGDVSRFAIESDILDTVDQWVYARFVMWAGGRCIGNRDDSVVLSIVYGNLKMFLSHQRGRRIDVLSDAPATFVFRKLFDSNMWTTGRPGSIHDLEDRALFKDAHDETLSCEEQARLQHTHHLDDIGATAFDGIDALLLERSDGVQRLLWRNTPHTEAEEVIEEQLFPPLEFERVATEFLSWVEQQIPAARGWGR